MSTLLFAAGGTLIPFPDPVGIGLAVAQVAASASLVNRYYKEYGRAVRNLEKGMDLQEEIVDWYHEFYLLNDSPQKIKAVMHAYEMELPLSDPDKYYRKTRGYVRALFSCADDWQEQMMGGSCVDAVHDCDRRMDSQIEKATVSLSHAGNARVKDRQHEYYKKKTTAVLASIQMANASPSASLNEINNYLSVWQNLAGLASGGFNGSLGVMGSSLGKVANHLAAEAA